MDSQYTAIDLFCGAGGFSLGLDWAGFVLSGSIDNDSAALKTYKHNFRHPVKEQDISTLTSDELLEWSGLKPRECTVVVGGPPCQGFSIQRRGKRQDNRNNLVKAFLDLALALEPKFFVIENVLGLLSQHSREFQQYVVEGAQEAGYRCHIGKLNAADFGVPQIRKRAFIVGERLDDGLSYFQFPQKKLNPDKYKTVRDAIASLPSPPSNGSPHPHVFNHYQEARLSKINIERISAVPEGGGRQHLPLSLQLPCHQNNKGHRHLDVYGRLTWDEPSVTITARFDSFTRGRFGHPSENRTITLREGARLQSFPDTFRFFGNREEVARQIGNAVPPLLAKSLSLALATALEHRQTGQPALENHPPSAQYSLL